MAQIRQKANISLDVWFEVIDHFLYDRSTLLASALTCSAWLPRARVHLYSSVALYKPETYRLFSRTIAGSPSLGALVKELELDVNTIQFKLWNDPSEADVLFPIEAARNLTGLHSLSLSNDSHHYIHPNVLDFIPRFAIATSLTKLLISDFGGRSPKTIIRILEHFPHIREFTLDGYFSKDDSYDPTETLPSDFCKNLRKLILIDNVLVAPFLAVMPDHITHLWLGRCFLIHGPTDPKVSYTDLARFKKLESLTLQTHHLDGIDWVAEALSHARCDELRSLTLVYQCECRRTCRTTIAQQHTEISRLAGIILRRPAFRQLQTLSVSVDADLDANLEKGLEDVDDATELKRRHMRGLDDVLRGCRDREIQVEIEVNVYRRKSLPRGYNPATCVSI
ncbi:hypothetical protein C8Q70DRAFT_916002 [Cubamyces menziesii]|nr:hypothetical protein C8Q70DRAFT_916002 [Cubamyces menziesii]